jgi:hypothetical protein
LEGPPLALAELQGRRAEDAGSWRADETDKLRLSLELYEAKEVTRIYAILVEIELPLERL